MDSTFQSLDSFFINGFYRGHIDFLDNYDIDQFKFANHDDPYRTTDENLKPLIQQVQSYLVNNHVSKIFDKYRVTDAFAWAGVDDYSKNWHNDSFEGIDSNILVYLDDSYGQNKIEFKSPTDEFTVFHKKGDFVWINQSKQFLHKATHITGKRRVLSFEFKWI